MRFFVSCARGLEYLLVDELLALGADAATAARAGANVEGSPELAYRAVLWSRLANRVLWPLHEFACADDTALYAETSTLDWTQHMDAQQTLAVDAVVSGPELTHARYAAQRTKDAVVDRLREATGARPSVDTEAPDLRLNLVVRKGRATLSVDLGGGSLHRRGWRRSQGDAPLKETLAAAVLLRGGWPQRYADGGGLLDPMCGSGTLLLEGAAMAADRAPGLGRFGERAPSRWAQFDLALWQRLVEEARGRDASASLRPVFFGSDSDAGAIHAAMANADAAGYAELVHFDRRAVSALQAPPVETGLVASNPPYDARLAADPALYRELGEALRRAVPAWRAALLCGDDQLAFATGLHATRKYTLYNGALPVTLIVCDRIAPPAAAGDEVLSDGARMVANRIDKNLRKLKRWREREDITCFRAYDADLPEYAAAIDVYTEEGPAARRWLHVQEYEAPAEIPEQDVRRRRRELLAAARHALAVPRELVALKSRQRGKGGAKYGRLDERGEFLWVREGAARLRVNLFDYLDTGLFLDHRPTRLRIAQAARGKRFLNLFCYTGAATVHAGLGGAASTTSVDLSATYLEWAAANLAGNGLAGAAHRLVQADAMRWLAAERGTYDLIFCDPPTFSNSARAADFDVQREHVELIDKAMARLALGGTLLFSNNFRRFRLDPALSERYVVAEVGPASIPPDFSRDPRIHRVWEIGRT